MNIITGFLILISAGHLCAADLRKEIAACSALDGDLDRLQCFDNLSRSFELNKPKIIRKIHPKAGKWILQVDQNPIDDTKTTVAILNADSGKSKQGNTVSLILRCMSNKLESYITWNDYLGSDRTEVTIRIGTNTATTSFWALSSDNTSSFYPGDVSEFFSQLSSANNFIAQVTPYNENPTTAIFDTTGAGKVIRPILQTCGNN